MKNFLGIFPLFLLTFSMLMIPNDKLGNQKETILIKIFCAIIGIFGTVVGHFFIPEALMISLAALAVITGKYASNFEKE